MTVPKTHKQGLGMIEINQVQRSSLLFPPPHYQGYNYIINYTCTKAIFSVFFYHWMTYPTAGLPCTRSIGVEPVRAVPTQPHRKLNG